MTREQHRQTRIEGFRRIHGANIPLPVSLTNLQQNTIERFRWLCMELQAGNQFSHEQLQKWIYQAEHALKDRRDIS